MKTNQSLHSIAVLSAATNANLGVVALTFELADPDSDWCQLLPAGEFSAVDGRPFDVPGGKWKINAEIAQRLISLAQNAANDLVVDYEHQTLNADKNGQPAPASGWFKDQMEWREGSGLWIKPKWTARASDFIRNKEYRYLSAVFPYSKATGEPLFIHSAALTNRAGIDGMQDLESLCAKIVPSTPDNTSHHTTQETPEMNEAIRKLLTKLGIELKDGQELTDAQATAVLTALDTLLAGADKSKELETEVAALKAGAGQTVDLSKYVPAETYNALVTEMASLKAGSDKESAKQLIADGRAAGKVLAAEEDYLNQLAEQQGIAALKGLIDSRPELTALQSQQTDGKDKDSNKDTGVASLSAQELEVCAATGVSPEAFLKTKGDK